LIYAAYHKNLDSIDMLQMAGAKMTVIDKKNRSAVHYAAMHDSEELMVLLFSNAKAVQWDTLEQIE